MAPLNSTIDLTRLRPGVKVRLRGEKPGPVKPYPKGWVEVVEVVHYQGGPPMSIRVVGDDRWIPTRLIEEMREP